MYIDVQNLSKTPAQSDVQILNVPQASFTNNGLNLVFGPSGSGKTTLLRLLAGIDEPTAGTVTVNGTCLTELASDEATTFRRKHIGYVFQDTNLIPELTAWENVSLPLTVDRGITLDAARKHAEEALSIVGLGDLADRYPEELSGGQQQRVGIARAICGNREVILADEPTGALDSENSRAVFQLLADLAYQGKLVILVSHDLTAQSYASSLFEIVDGHMRAIATKG